MVNLGCGDRYHPEWINIDIAPQSREVIRHDLSQSLPFEDASCDVVYHSAVIEHMRRTDVLPFLRECHRVLKRGGLIRIAVPDLEKLCQLYLLTLDAVTNGDANAGHNYNWLMLEMFDQTVRELSGGEMLAYLRQETIPNEQFVLERIGEEGRNLISALRQVRVTPRSEHSARWVSIKHLASIGRRLPNEIRRRLLSRLLGTDGIRALAIGRFRLAGEVHHWGYDRYSLFQLLLAAGFSEPRQQSAVSSRIHNWVNFHLDALPDGTVIKPDLFYMEAIKL